jgi:uncharacterized membrane-anchored protein YjiN (DUF445 family)
MPTSTLNEPKVAPHGTQPPEDNAQVVIERLARHEISEDEAEGQLRQILEQAYRDTLIRKILRQWFPSLIRTAGGRPKR